ncbi:unnamed protein product [Gordionus sp. m RMFG-2023]|uniref:trypsin 3A1-like n=1 Tax=Gordionus sp. m RMFG-2023 TaxID=3053472 RepID=UPI0030E33BDC
MKASQTIRIPNQCDPIKPTTPANGHFEQEVTCGVTKQVPAAPDCSKISQSIFGGQESNPLSWPWQVALTYYGQPFCGGSLINRDTVLTAAHCTVNISSEDVVIYLGSNNFKDPNIVKIPAKSVIKHPNYYATTVKNDISIIKLERKVDYGDAIKPICLPSAEERVKDGYGCYVTGWGDTKNLSLPMFNRLREVCLNVVNKAKCQNVMGIVDDNMICAGVSDGRKDSCQGDSGGPMACKIGTNWKLTGIVSWGVGCGEPGFPGVYTDVGKFLEWIQSNI